MTNDVLTTSLQQVRQRQQRTFYKYIDGSITQEDYDANSVRYAEEVAELEAKQKQLDDIDQKLLRNGVVSVKLFRVRR